MLSMGHTHLVINTLIGGIYKELSQFPISSVPDQLNHYLLLQHCATKKSLLEWVCSQSVVSRQMAQTKQWTLGTPKDSYSKRNHRGRGQRSQHQINGQKWPEHRVKQQKLLITITFIFTFLSSTLAGIISFRQNNVVWVLERSRKWENK